MNSTISFIVTLDVQENQLVTQRCVGFYPDYEEAAHTVCENVCDIYEGIYNYAVIIEIPYGLYPCDTVTHWFQITENDTYKEIEEPEFAKYIDILQIV